MTTELGIQLESIKSQLAQCPRAGRGQKYPTNLCARAIELLRDARARGLSTSEAVTVSIIGDRDFFHNSSNKESLRRFSSKLSEWTRQPIVFVESSEYASELSENFELIPMAVHVTSWFDIRIWFTLSLHGERSLGVRLIDHSPVDVYMDHP